MFSPKLINSTKWKHDYIISKKMAESNDLTWETDNVFIPKYVPDNLKWHEKDGLETWYRKNKCDEFLSNTDLHFKNRKIVNFDIIKNNVDKKKLQQYQTIDHDEIKNYPPHFQNQIRSSIFRNSTRSDINIQKETIKEHFTNKKVSTGRGRFLKKVKEDMYGKYW